MGYLLASPLRRMKQNPRKILSPWLEPGMQIVEVGPGMGFFTFDLARMAGPTGRVIAVDIEPRMLRVLDRRARRRGLQEQIETRVCGPDALGLDDLRQAVDFVLALAVVHEVPDARALFGELRGLMKPGGNMLFSEPKMVQEDDDFEQSLAIAAGAGFTVIEELEIRGNRSRLLKV
jgi:ubiquinone/menaquinone biosynthesis C-methylase UbiE